MKFIVLVLDVHWIKMDLIEIKGQKELRLKVIAMIQDGSGKATLRLENQMVIKAFGLTPKNLQKIEDYCRDKGEYIFPKSDPDNTLLARDILAFFKSAHTFKNLTIYAKPFAKISLNR